VILNRLGGVRHEAKLRAVIEHYTDVPVLGAVQQDARLTMVERHLGLMPDAEVNDAAARVRVMARAVASQVDLDRVLALANTAPALPLVALPTPTAAGAAPRLRIGIARDAAFGFYYPDDLAELEAAGASLVPIDTLHDGRLPALDGLFIGGGFPETAMDALAANTALRAALRQAIEAGLPTYAECGGLMYLSRSIRWGDRSAPMVGAIPGDVLMHERPVGRGYVQIEESADFPWPRLDAAAPALRHGHEFHHSSLIHVSPTVRYAYRVRRGHGIDGQHDGVCVHNLLASYAHLRHTGGNHWPQRFLAFVRSVRGQSDSRPLAA